MALRIAQLNTTCHIPRSHRANADTVDRLARGRFAHDLGGHLGPSLARQPAIIRIRRLALRVIIPVSELNEDALSLKWRQEFGKALFTALAYPPATGPFEVFRAESVASFIASAIHDLLDGTAPTQWQYAEFESFFRQGSVQGALSLICEWPHQTLAVLMELSRRRVLDRVLARFDDLAVERLFALLAPAATEPLTIADVVKAARLVLAQLPDKANAIRSRQYALSLFVRAQTAPEPFRSPRTLFHALTAIAVLLNEEVFWPGVPRDELWTKRLPPPVTALLEAMAESFRRRPSADAAIESPGTAPAHGETSSRHFAELRQLVANLRTELKIPFPAESRPEVRWISTDWCGLFFLTGTLARLGWVRAWNQLSEFQTGGVSCLIAGLALAVLEKFDPDVAALDPGLALFAGYLADPDLAHLRRVFHDFPRDTRLNVLRAALPHDRVDDAADNWAAAFDLLAANLLQNFGSRIRGFRQASRHGIVRTFLARPGRIRIEPERLVVFPAPNPFHVALHIAGIDDPVPQAPWLGGRRLEFELGDL
jgi:hypothetical protein